MPSIKCKCSQTFKDKNRFSLHIKQKNHVEINFSYQCKLSNCSREYAQLKSLQKHSTTFHKLVHVEQENSPVLEPFFQPDSEININGESLPL